MVPRSSVESCNKRQSKLTVAGSIIDGHYLIRNSWRLQSWKCWKSMMGIGIGEFQPCIEAGWFGLEAPCWSTSGIQHGIIAAVCLMRNSFLIQTLHCFWHPSRQHTCTRCISWEMINNLKKYRLSQEHS